MQASLPAVRPPRQARPSRRPCWHGARVGDERQVLTYEAFGTAARELAEQ
jgi:hypothetical protein